MAFSDPRIERNELLSRLEGPLVAKLASARALLAPERQGEPAPAAWGRALPGLERLLPEGLLRGELVELVAGRSSGRFASVLALLAAATRAGENAAFVDLGGGLDPQAATATGIDWSRLLWVRPHDIREALAATEAALTGGFPIVALDLGMPPLPGGRGAETMWIRLARSARAHGGLVFVAAPYRVSGTAATTVLELARARALWSGAGRSPRLLDGTSGHLRLQKARHLDFARDGEALLFAAGGERPHRATISA